MIIGTEILITDFACEIQKSTLSFSPLLAFTLGTASGAERLDGVGGCR